MMPGLKRYGTRKGRLMYRTAEEARAVAADLGLSDVHSHVRGGERLFMPGADHEKLNRALQQRGLPTTPVPGEGGGGMMGGGGGGGGGQSSGPMPIEVPTVEPVFDVDDLTGDRDDDDNMEIY